MDEKKPVKISIIMPSYLGAYKRAAKDRDKKIVRAIQSVINQTYKDWELIIVADGCNKTVEIVQNVVELTKDPRIRCIYIDKQPLWSGVVRNTGIMASEGKYCLYLDIDDAFAPEHLEEIAPSLNGKDWYWMDDWVYAQDKKEFRHRKCDINVLGRCGTSNLIHKPGLAWWNENDNYAHDWKFIANLKQASKDYEYINAGKYLVCHIPGRTEV